MSLKIVQIVFLIFFIVIFSSCKFSANQKVLTSSIEEFINEKTIEIDSSKIAFSFDFPVGKPDAKGYYDYQGFTKK